MINQTHPEDLPKADVYQLRLYVAGSTPRSLLAIKHMRSFCDEQLIGGYDLEVIDIYQQPWRAKADEIVAVPTLLRCAPPPERRLVGDLSKTERVMVTLALSRQAAS